MIKFLLSLMQFVPLTVSFLCNRLASVCCHLHGPHFDLLQKVLSCYGPQPWSFTSRCRSSCLWLFSSPVQSLGVTPGTVTHGNKPVRGWYALLCTQRGGQHIKLLYVLCVGSSKRVPGVGLLCGPPFPLTSTSRNQVLPFF